MKHTAIRFDRTLINPKGDSVRYLEVSMDAPEPDRRSKRKRAPMDLALVIDRSGSMQGEPLAAAREAARGVAQQLRAKDTLSVVVFDDCVDTLFEGLSMTKAGKTRADAMLAGIHSGGMTASPKDGSREPRRSPAWVKTVAAARSSCSPMAMPTGELPTPESWPSTRRR